ncbi:hypothetical protein AMELA_G00128700 [Ameiurus melas]|uniref:Secreted protein n=1 Tax=Ameiurus melas TaxID=219545 RepID=A0A7J6AQQ7_AMEME|nr:hypothetical protein AMELA_G00128700 [Ameiurus melas]
MRTVDRVSLHLGFLLAFTVILKCESCRHERCLRYGTETLPLSELGTKTPPNGHHSRDGKAKIPGSCFLCKAVVKALKNYSSGQFTRCRTDTDQHIRAEDHGRNADGDSHCNSFGVLRYFTRCVFSTHSPNAGGDRNRNAK